MIRISPLFSALLLFSILPLKKNSASSFNDFDDNAYTKGFNAEATLYHYAAETPSEFKVPCYDEFEKSLIKANHEFHIRLYSETYALNFYSSRVDIMSSFKSIGSFSWAMVNFQSVVKKINKEFCDCILRTYGKTGPGC